MTVEIRHPSFASVVGPSVEFEKLGTDFLFTEGPLWNEAGKYLLFSDMPGDRIRRWSAESGVVEFRNPSNKSNGLTWDREGRLLACEHATSRVTRTEPDGRITVLASHHEGKELNSPNDIVVATGRRDLLHRSDIWQDRVLRRSPATRTWLPGCLQARSRRRDVEAPRG